MPSMTIIGIALALILLMGVGIVWSEFSQTTRSTYGITTYRVLSTEKNSNATLQNSVYLQFPVTASSQYWFTAQIFIDTAGAMAGFKSGLSIPDSGSVMTYCAQYVTNIALGDIFNSCTGTNATSVGTITAGTANEVLITITGFVNVGTSGGIVYFMFATGTNGVEADLEGQSVMVVYSGV